MSAQPRSHYPHRRHGRRPSDQPSSSDSEDEKLSSSAADPSRRRRGRGDNESNSGSKPVDDRDKYAVVRRSSEEVYAVAPARRRQPSVVSTGTHYEEYDLRNRGARDRQPRARYRGEASREKRRSRLDPRWFLAALCCFAGVAFCWDDIVDD